MPAGVSGDWCQKLFPNITQIKKPQFETFWGEWIPCAAGAADGTCTAALTVGAENSVRVVLKAFLVNLQSVCSARCWEVEARAVAPQMVDTWARGGNLEQNKKPGHFLNPGKDKRIRNLSPSAPQCPLTQQSSFYFCFLLFFPLLLILLVISRSLFPSLCSLFIF